MNFKHPDIKKCDLREEKHISEEGLINHMLCMYTTVVTDLNDESAIM